MTYEHGEPGAVLTLQIEEEERRREEERLAVNWAARIFARNTLSFMLFFSEETRESVRNEVENAIYQAFLGSKKSKQEIVTAYRATSEYEKWQECLAAKE